MRLLRLSIEYDERIVLSSVATLYALDESVRRSESAATNIHDGKIVGQAPHAIRKLGERLT